MALADPHRSLSDIEIDRLARARARTAFTFTGILFALFLIFAGATGFLTHALLRQIVPGLSIAGLCVVLLLLATVALVLIHTRWVSRRHDLPENG